MRRLESTIRRLVRDQRGFTLVELLVVVTIIAILSLVVKSAVEGYIVKSRIARCQAELAAMRSVVQQYYVEAERYPSPAATTGLPALMKKAGIRWDDKDPRAINDPWGKAYVYGALMLGSGSPDKNSWFLASAGPDKRWGSGDEIYADFFGVTPKGTKEIKQFTTWQYSYSSANR